MQEFETERKLNETKVAEAEFSFSAWYANFRSMICHLLRLFKYVNMTIVTFGQVLRIFCDY
jgi:hypothetical protein